MYSPGVCCPAFKDLGVPVSRYLNDLTNVCASTMFSYINLYGKYPPGLFTSECREGRNEGLACPASLQSASTNPTNSATRPLHIARNTLPLPLLAAPSFLTLLRLNKVLRLPLS
ncbi:hypothetical protein MLD38_035089 [Melastoma candidum]|uniref:Uncharacterized protein n=1 Tax=Melastoma candidum TaxID=119954 RepID=A0ACB9MC05_9MYRT|nr:hypothetical protein MLD38_035089 [Melastoma candidum]